MNRGKVLFRVFVIILSLISIFAIYIALKWKVELGIFIATAVSAIVYPLFALAKRYVWVPHLEILFNPQENPDVYRPIITFVNPQTGQVLPPRLFLRICIFNKGSATARNCVGEIQLEPNGRPQGCTAFSGEPKILQWTRSIEPIDILQKQSATLNVAFAQEGLSAVFAGTCNYQGQPPEIRAWASTTDAILAPNYRLQDGFCEGQFRIRITIYSENTEPLPTRFILNVGSNWQQLEMQLV
ncbi:MAG: hypothetical protein QXR19_04380 [Candidatus Jordarchaeaceae archaeon]